MKEFILKWYPVILAFICLLYSVGLAIAGKDRRGTIFCALARDYIVIRTCNYDKEENHEYRIFTSRGGDICGLCVVYFVDYFISK